MSTLLESIALSSQFMENWCYHPPTLLGLTGHYRTAERLPEELFEKIRAGKNYRAGSMMLRQLFFGMIDIELHSNWDMDSSETPYDVQERIGRLMSVLPPLSEDRSICSFQHIFSGGYAAGYYSF